MVEISEKFQRRLTALEAERKNLRRLLDAAAALDARHAAPPLTREELDLSITLPKVARRALGEEELKVVPPAVTRSGPSGK